MCSFHIRSSASVSWMYPMSLRTIKLVVYSTCAYFCINIILVSEKWGFKDLNSALECQQATILAILKGAYGEQANKLLCVYHHSYRNRQIVLSILHRFQPEKQTGFSLG